MTSVCDIVETLSDTASRARRPGSLEKKWILLDGTVLGQVVVLQGFNKPSTFSCIERWISHTGDGKDPAVGSSGEYWSIGESLNQGFAGMRD